MEAASPQYDPRYLAGIVLFNRGDFFEAHEVWEIAVDGHAGPEKTFYQGLIQAAVGLCHFCNGNVRGASSSTSRAGITCIAMTCSFSASIKPRSGSRWTPATRNCWPSPTRRGRSIQVVEKARQAGIAADEDFSKRILERVKQLEHEGFQFEAADGSFELLMRKEAGVYEPLFRLESWRAIVEKHADGRATTEATIKIWVGGERYVRTAEGNGPVHALDRALRDAIGESHPHLKDIELVNFKVRILDERKGTGAVTRVLIDASDGHDVWGSIGVAENLIAASWDALVDSLEYGMQGERRTASESTLGSTGRV